MPVYIFPVTNIIQNSVFSLKTFLSSLGWTPCCHLFLPYCSGCYCYAYYSIMKSWTWPLSWYVYGHSDLLVLYSQCLVLCWAQPDTQKHLTWIQILLSGIFELEQWHELIFNLNLLCRLCYDAFTENMAGENQLMERRRLYHCAAYNCAISVICCVFNELKFYHGFLFCEKPEKVGLS